MRSLLWTLGALLASVPAHAGSVKSPSQATLAAKATSETTTGSGSATRADMILLTVEKKSLTADLKTWPENPADASSLRRFRIAIGKAEGDKEREGDNKTPEGIYFAQRHIDGNTLPEKYGARAIPIDFPNPMDVVMRKTGYGIWLHGVDRDERIEEAKVTEGCVAFYNSDIDRLSGWLKSHQGVVVIAQDASEVNRAEDVTAVREATMAWMDDWAARRVDQYISWYAPDFRYERMDRAGYRDYKARVFKGYREMTIGFENLRVVTHPKYAVSFFNQDFRGDSHFVSIGRKILYWERGGDGRWLIKREVFENRRFEHLTFTDGELALLSAQESGISSEDQEKSAPSL